MLEVVVGKGNHQGHDNGEDDGKGHGDIGWHDEQVREAIFIDAFDHVLKAGRYWDAIVDAFGNRPCIAQVKDVKSQINRYDDEMKGPTNEHEKGVVPSPHTSQGDEVAQFKGCRRDKVEDKGKGYG